MIKRFRIVVDGIAHEVEVEELSRSNSVAAAPVAVPVAAPTPAPKAAPAPAPKATPAPKEAPAGAVTAPLPGTVLDVPVSVGQQVKAGQILAIIEAMKMENEIVAPTDGTVASIAVRKGDAVEADDLLVTLQ